MSVVYKEKKEESKSFVGFPKEEIQLIENLSDCYQTDYRYFFDKELQKELSPNEYIEHCLGASLCINQKQERFLLKNVPENKREVFKMLAKLNSKGRIMSEEESEEELCLAEMISFVYPELLEKIKSYESKDLKGFPISRYSYSFLFAIFLASCMPEISTLPGNSLQVLENPPVVQEILIDEYREEISSDKVEEEITIEEKDDIVYERPNDEKVNEVEEENEKVPFPVDEEKKYSDLVIPTLKQEQEINPLEKISFLAKHEIFEGDTERNNIMITYDDGGSEASIYHIMDIYDKYDFKATFFVTGQWVERNPDLVKSMINRGFEIGCHGWDHQEMRHLGVENARVQMEKFLEIMKEIAADYEVRFIRFPYGSRDLYLREVAAELGLQSVMWNVCSNGTIENTYKTVLDKAKPGTIVLSHSTRWYDIHQAELILEGLKELGYSASTVGEGMSDRDRFSLE